MSLLTSSIRPPTQVARELGVQPPLLHHWRDDRQANGTVTGSVGSRSSGDVSAEHAESRRMEKEPARAQIERGGLAMDERINQELTLNMRQASARVAMSPPLLQAEVPDVPSAVILALPWLLSP